MNWLIVLRPARVGMLIEGATAEESAAVARHFEYFRRLAAEGRVDLAGRTTEDDDRTIGLVLLSASSEEEARAIMSNDPAVVQGVMQAELHPFRIALRSGA